MNIDFSMGTDLLPITPFPNSRKAHWVTYKIELSPRVTIHEKRIKPIVGIGKTTQMIINSMREAFEKSYLLKMPEGVKHHCGARIWCNRGEEGGGCSLIVL